MAFGYVIPAETYRIETLVVNSRFIASVAYTPTVDDAKAFIAQVRKAMADASHHVYAYKVGYGNSIIESMSDDGEPAGTAGPPVMAVLRGVDIGDTTVVITRYFGGTLLGTGGLVRAYTESAKAGLAGVALQRKIDRKTVALEVPYPWFQQVRRLYEPLEAVDIQETFEANVIITAKFPSDNTRSFIDQVIEMTAGAVHPFIVD
ncbi:MAG: YigZ family protein [bacterium]|nr:YigZ family protein [bacterium]